jgi:DNA polymerase-3 subunit alpha
MSEFVHLHVHSHYSLLDGANRIPDLIKTARDYGMDAIALTDHGNLFGAVEFYTSARDAGLKPILGIEAYISPTTRFDKSMGNINTASYHLILLAMNEKGWSNLIKLSSRSYLEGFYYRPRIDRQLLEEFNEGLICTTACIGGEVPSALLSGQVDQARRIAGEYLDIFGRDRFFLEVQNQQLDDQARINPQMIDLGRALGVGLVGTNDVHFLQKQDKPAHKVLTCISTGKTLTDPENSTLKYSPELYLKTPEQMCEVLKGFPDAVTNTLKIAEMCNLKLDFTAKHPPTFRTPGGEDPVEYLRKLALEGLNRRCGDSPPTAYRQRLQRELEVIETKHYSSYVLIVCDFVRHAKSNDIPCGARGSGCATLLGYCLGISDVDPVRYGLLFERFADPQRDEDPDFDIDICQEGRAKVIQYVREKYGHVAQIITYGTLKARAVIRDVGRVMDIPLGEVDAIAKKVPDALGTTLQGALVGEPDLRGAYDSDPRMRELFDHGMKLEGLARHAGVHAAGVVVADEPLENLVPLYKQAESEEVITQWDGPTCDKIGLMRMDFLGLRTLTTIQRAGKLVRARTGEDIDPEELPLDDPGVFELFCKGETDGVFQFESGGMKNVLVQMQPNRIEDLIAANAMYRPGPMQLIETYCARKNETEQVPSIHPLVDDILAETYGIMIYQEQVMQVLNRLGKLPMNQALTLIRAISKKKEKEIAAVRPGFLRGAEENGIGRDEAEGLFELILKFAGYGFNKALCDRRVPDSLLQGALPPRIHGGAADV